MEERPLFDLAQRIHEAFAGEPNRSWLLRQLQEWRRNGGVVLLDSAGDPLTPTDPKRPPHWPCRAPGEYVAESERTIFTIQEICFALAAIHDAHQQDLELATNVQVEAFVERGSALWAAMAPHYGFRLAKEINSAAVGLSEVSGWNKLARKDGEVSRSWDEGRLERLGSLFNQAIAAAAIATRNHGNDTNDQPSCSVETDELPPTLHAPAASTPSAIAGNGACVAVITPNFRNTDRSPFKPPSNDVATDAGNFVASGETSQHESASLPNRPPDAPTIPPEYRTRAMTKKKAASLMRGGNLESAVEWLSSCIEDGTVPCDTLSRQSHVFDIRSFPAEAQAQLGGHDAKSAGQKRLPATAGNSRQVTGSDGRD